MLLLEVDDINGIVNKKDLHLSLTDKAVLQELVQVFEQFKEATKLVQGDTYASVCVALPCFIGLQKHIETTSIWHLQNLVHFLKENLMTRLSAIKSDSIFIIATVLHPKFKPSRTSSVSEINNVKKKRGQIWLAMLIHLLLLNLKVTLNLCLHPKGGSSFLYGQKSHYQQNKNCIPRTRWLLSCCSQ